MLLHRRRPSVSPSERASPAATHNVRVADGLAPLVEPLRALLPPHFTVDAGPPGTDAVAVLRPLGLAAISFWRCKYPRAVLIIVATDAAAPHDACAYLNAGADVYVDEGSPRLVAAHILAAVRRAVGGNGTLNFGGAHPAPAA